jgi:16S rRNA (uracil1498-N3)-methyltransferase
VLGLAQWLASATPAARFLLCLHPEARPLSRAIGASLAASLPVTFLSGPEGGLSSAEESLARAKGFLPVTLGPRVLRAETAALAALVASTFPA